MQTNSTLGIHSEPECKQTIGTVLGSKVVRFVADNTMGSLIKKLAEFALGLFLGAFIFKPGVVAHFIREAFIMQDFALTKIMAGFVIIYFRKYPIKLFRKIRKFRKKLDDHIAHNSKMVDGIPVDELADYLVRNGNFRREGVNGARQTFGLRMEKYNQLAKKLEENGVLIRGENNLRILAPKWSRQALIDLLSQTTRSQDMGPWFRVHRIGGKVRLDRQEITLNPTNP